MRKQHGFTLVELMVVLAIIALLLAILLPVLRKARDAANALACSSNQRQLIQAFLAFASDHSNCLPGNKLDKLNPTDWKRDWLMGSGLFADAPQSGTLFPYLRNPNTYLCPSLQGEAVLGARAGSNGRFDYAAFQSLPGANIHRIKNTSRFKYDDGTYEILPTPVLVQEDAFRINGSNPEGGHSKPDQFAKLHNRGSYYAAIDGSVQFFKEPPSARADLNWDSQTPSGLYHSLGDDFNWGLWNTQ